MSGLARARGALATATVNRGLSADWSNTQKRRAFLGYAVVMTLTYGVVTVLDDHAGGADYHWLIVAIGIPYWPLCALAIARLDRLRPGKLLPANEDSADKSAMARRPA